MKTWTFSSKSYPCPIALTANLLSSRWRTNVLWYIWTGTNRFNQIARELPHLNQGVLMRVLRELEADGLISRKEHGPRPAPVEYSLTDLGLSLRSLLAQMAEWGRGHGTEHEAEER